MEFLTRDQLSFLVYNFGPLYVFLHLLHCFGKPAILDVRSCLPHFFHIFVGIGFHIPGVPHTPHLTTTLPNIICQCCPQAIIVPNRFQAATHRKPALLRVACTISFALFGLLQTIRPSETWWLFDVPRDKMSHDTVGPCFALSESF